MLFAARHGMVGLNVDTALRRSSRAGREQGCGGSDTPSLRQGADSARPGTAIYLMGAFGWAPPR